MASTISIAIDIGDSCKVATASADQPCVSKLLSNDLSNMATPSVVGFGAGGVRTIGEAAASQLAQNRQNTVDRIAELLSPDALPEELPFEAGVDGVVVAFGDGGAARALQPAAVLAMLLAKLERQARESVGAEKGDAELALTLCLPSFFSAAETRVALDAALIAGLEVAGSVSSMEAVAAAYGCKMAAFRGHALFVDVGASHATAAVASYEDGAEEGAALRFTIVALESMRGVGGHAFDRKIFELLAAEAAEKYGAEPMVVTNRRGVRLLQSARKLKHLLSTVKDASITCENLLEDRDVNFKLSSADFEAAVAAELGAIGALVARVAGAAAEVKDADGVQTALSAVEVVGGMSRSPAVQMAIAASCTLPLGHHLDSSSAVAAGAAVIGVAPALAADFEGARPPMLVAPPGAADLLGSFSLEGMSEGQIEFQKAEELEWQAIEQAAERLGAARSELEGYLFEVRGLLSGSRDTGGFEAHVLAELLDKDAITPAVDGAESWLYSEEADGATVEQVEATRAQLKAVVDELAAPYYAAVQAQKEKTEAELTAGEAQDKKDHEGKVDDTKLPYSKRLHKLTINKDEGTGLFKDGNYQLASQRYLVALGHTKRFFDMNAEQKAEVAKLTLSLQLNLAVCYAKLEQHKEAIKHCDAALELDDQSAKALFRRANARIALKAYDEASKDLKAAAKLAPEDKQVIKAQARVKKLVDHQKAKERKMYSKMF